MFEVFYFAKLSLPVYSQGHLDNKAIQLINDVTRVVLIFPLTEIEKRFSHAARVKVKSLGKCWSQSMY